MTCLDWKSLLGNTKELQTQAPWQYRDHWRQYSLNNGLPKLSLIVLQNSGNRANPEMTVHKKYYTHNIKKFSAKFADNCWSEQSSEKSTVPFFFWPHGIDVNKYTRPRYFIWRTKRTSYKVNEKIRAEYSSSFKEACAAEILQYFLHFSQQRGASLH